MWTTDFVFDKNRAPSNTEDTIIRNKHSTLPFRLVSVIRKYLQIKNKQ